MDYRTATSVFIKNQHLTLRKTTLTCPKSFSPVRVAAYIFGLVANRSSYRHCWSFSAPSVFPCAGPQLNAALSGAAALLTRVQATLLGARAPQMGASASTPLGQCSRRCPSDSCNISRFLPAPHLSAPTLRHFLGPLRRWLFFHHRQQPSPSAVPEWWITLILTI